MPVNGKYPLAQCTEIDGRGRNLHANAVQIPQPRHTVLDRPICQQGKIEPTTLVLDGTSGTDQISCFLRSIGHIANDCPDSAGVNVR